MRGRLWPIRRAPGLLAVPGAGSALLASASFSEKKFLKVSKRFHVKHTQHKKYQRNMRLLVAFWLQI